MSEAAAETGGSGVEEEGLVRRIGLLLFLLWRGREARAGVLYVLVFEISKPVAEDEARRTLCSS